METKIKSFLQSDIFILSISLLLGFLCHLFVVTEIVAYDKEIKDNKSHPWYQQTIRVAK